MMTILSTSQIILWFDGRILRLCSKERCLHGNPSPACRHLLRQVPEETPILVWAALDYGGFNILAGLRRRVSRRCQPYQMDR